MKSLRVVPTVCVADIHWEGQPIRPGVTDPDSYRPQGAGGGQKPVLKLSQG